MCDLDPFPKICLHITSKYVFTITIIMWQFPCMLWMHFWRLPTSYNIGGWSATLTQQRYAFCHA